MEWKVEEISELRGYAVEYAEAGNYYLSRRSELFHSENLQPPFKKIAVVDAPFYKQFAANFRLAQRLLRFMVTNIIPLSNGDLFVTFDKSVGIVRNGKYQVLKGLERPCRVLRSACAVNADGDVFFGEYIANTERGAMKIYKYSPGNDALDAAYIFPENTIRHIHGIYFDEYSNSMFCLTGDDDKECCFWQTFDGFKTIKTIGSGDETWRAVSVLFNENAFFYGMDAEYRTNHIYKVKRENLERKSLGEVSGTVFYSKKIGADLFFATTAENAPSQIENVAALWSVDSQDRLQKLVSFNKDGWHATLFMFGTIHFPYQNLLEDELYFQLVGVKEDNRTFRVKHR